LRRTVKAGAAPDSETAGKRSSRTSPLRKPQHDRKNALLPGE
jgi:hypothetical protein